MKHGGQRGSTVSRPNKKEADFIIAESKRLKQFGTPYGIRLCGFDHLGSQYGPSHATFVNGKDNNQRVTLPYWFIERLSIVPASVVKRCRGGRVPGAISKRWKVILNDIYNNEPVTVEQIYLLAAGRGVHVYPSSAQARMHKYIDLGYISLAAGGYVLTQTAIHKFDLKKKAGGRTYVR